MFNGVSLSDRLKAAVNQIEATGSSLQARAIGAQSSTSNSASTQAAHETVPKNTSQQSSPTVIISAGGQPKSPIVDHEVLQSPSRISSYATTTNQLAENALLGLRRNLHLTRPSVDGLKGGSANSTSAESKETSKLSTVISSSSRSSSPSHFLQPATFSLGSLSSSAAPTPFKASPADNSPVSQPNVLPKPDPNDPATYPLPMSPLLTQESLPEIDASDDFSAPSSPPRATETIIAPLPGFHTQLMDTERKYDSSDIATNSAVSSPLDKSKDSLDKGLEFEDLIKRHTALQSQTQIANEILKALTPLEGGIADSEALEGWVRMVTGKVELMTGEMTRLQDKLTLQESRMEELRDTHRLESASQGDLIAKLRSDLSTAESNLSAKASDLLHLAQLRTDLAKAQTAAKEEEEKRTKAISLLKTVRQKLVKVEKEKEEIERDRAEERAERAKAAVEAEKMKAEREREVNSLRKGFDRELSGVKERYEKDLSSKKAVWELEMITTKAGHAKELSNKATKISGLEAIVKELNLTKSTQFATIQTRQAESEMARAEMEALQTRTKELEFQLREATERCALLDDAQRDGRSFLPDAIRGNASPSDQGGVVTSAEVQRLLAEADLRAEAKVSELRLRVRSLERERNELEEDWAMKLRERLRELEQLRQKIQDKEAEQAESMRARREKEARIDEHEAKRREMEREIIEFRSQIEEAQAELAVAAEAERSTRNELAAVQEQVAGLLTQVDDGKGLATQLRSNNKTLREELRKVQSSVLLLERQRNPGVGYWSANVGSPQSVSGVPSPGPLANDGTVTDSPGSPAPSDKPKDEEEVNLEYLRNVILQFLEHKEMRPNLVRVLSVILRFTPQELRRLNSKLLT